MFVKKNILFYFFNLASPDMKHKSFIIDASPVAFGALG